MTLENTNIYINELDGWKGFEVVEKGSFCLMKKGKTLIFLPTSASDQEVNLIIYEVRKMYE